MILGIPVICFDAASGIAEIQKQEDELSFLAVPYMDAAAAAGVLAQLASSAELMKATKLATQKVAEAKFDMEAYVERLDSLGVAAASRSTSSVNSHATIPV
jgi:glycosyltransferase involved in cell wall biosynthesis